MKRVLMLLLLAVGPLAAAADPQPIPVAAKMLPGYVKAADPVIRDLLRQPIGTYAVVEASSLTVDDTGRVYALLARRVYDMQAPGQFGTHMRPIKTGGPIDPVLLYQTQWGVALAFFQQPQMRWERQRRNDYFGLEPVTQIANVGQATTLSTERVMGPVRER